MARTCRTVTARPGEDGERTGDGGGRTGEDGGRMEGGDGGDVGIRLCWEAALAGFAHGRGHEGEEKE